MTTTAQPYRVSNKIHAAILQSDAIPLFGHVPEFPWKKLTATVAKQLELEGLQLSASDCRWLEADKAANDLGSPLASFSFRCNEIDGSVYWLMPEESLNQFIAWVLTKLTNPLGIPDGDIRAGLRKFISIEMCHCFDQLKYAGGVTPMVASDTQLPSSGALLCCDITVTYKEQSLVGRIAFSSNFMEQWRTKVGHQKVKEIPKEFAQKVMLDAHIVSGQVSLTSEQWAGVKPGDCLIPDNLFLEMDPESGKFRGHAWMTVNGITVAQARVRRNGQVEIIETAQG